MEKKEEFAYVVRAIYADEITKEKNERNYEIHKIKYNKPNLTLDEFNKFQSDWKLNKWDIGGFDSSYHFDKEEAINYAKKNIGDINEAGCYMYAAVCPLPIGLAYYNTGIDKNDIILFKYEREEDEYKTWTPDSSEKELYERILNYVWGFI